MQRRMCRAISVDGRQQFAPFLGPGLSLRRMKRLVRRTISGNGRQQFAFFVGSGLPLRCMQFLVCHTFRVDSRTDGTDVGSKFGVLGTKAGFNAAKLGSHIAPKRDV